jgi:electron transfer flavoprotein beta subunit
MKTIVLVKQVPHTHEVKLDPKTGNLQREGVESIINPDDRHALEAGIALRETRGGTVTVLSMGPLQAIDALSEALGLGADEAILLSDRAFAGADTWATSTTLGRAIQQIAPFDLVICGRQAIDGDTAQIGPQVAEYLRIPHLSYVFEIERPEESRLVVKRRLDDGYERVATPLPALLTVLGEMNRPRYPRVGALLAACENDAPIRIWNAADLGLKTAEVGLEGSLTRVTRAFAPKSERRAERLEGSAGEVAAKLLAKLWERKLA